MKEHVKYVYGEFVDFAGATHKFTVAGVSRIEPTDKEDNLISIEGPSVMDYTKGLYLSEYIPIKGLLIGVSICSPNDTYDKELGEKIAYSKAVNVKDLYSHTALYTPVFGLINDEVVTAVLDNYAKYITKNPGAIIAGYNKSEKKFLENKAKEEFEASLPQEVKSVLAEIDSLKYSNLELLNKALKNRG